VLAAHHDIKRWTAGMGLDKSIARLFKGDITDDEGQYLGMYAFQFHMVQFHRSPAERELRYNSVLPAV
jgi:hypothetical protein